jgi:hypothetical protein
MLQLLYTHVASVCFKCFICFLEACCKLGVVIWMLHMFCNDFLNVFSNVFANVSNACFKCFICLQTYVANVSYGCFKSRSRCYTCCNGADGWRTTACRRALAPTSRLPRTAHLALSSPFPPFLSLLFPPSCHSSVGNATRRGDERRWWPEWADGYAMSAW